LKSKNYESMSLKELREEAKKRNIKYYYRFRKNELIEILKKEDLKNIDKDEIIEIISSNSPMAEIRKIAAILGIKLSRNMKKIEIIECIRNKVGSKRNVKVERKSGVYPSSSKFKDETQPETQEQLLQIKTEEPPNRIPNLPDTYNKDKLVCLPVNPHWIHIYWDFSKETIEKLKKFKNATLRVYDVTYIIFNGKNAHRVFEVDIDPIEVKKYYFNVPSARANYIAEIGFKRGDEFIPLLRSNFVETPPDSPGNLREEIWVDLKSFKKTKEKSEGMIIKPIEKLFKAKGSSINPQYYTNQ